jgi:hypothetical protein
MDTDFVSASKGVSHATAGGREVGLDVLAGGASAAMGTGFLDRR